MKNIVLFASGSGTNAENIIKHFAENKLAKVSAVFCNRPDAFVIERAKKLNVPVVVFGRKEFYESDAVLQKLKSLQTDLIVLAGFLWLVPDKLIRDYEGRIINIHPALLPKYGGKGMYGAKVHEAVLAAGEKESGITIHFVNEHFDAGKIIFQAKCTIEQKDTAETVATKVHQLEHLHFPKVIGQLLQKI